MAFVSAFTVASHGIAAPGPDREPASTGHHLVQLVERRDRVRVLLAERERVLEQGALDAVDQVGELLDRTPRSDTADFSPCPDERP